MPSFSGDIPVQIKTGRVPVVTGFAPVSGDHTQRDDLATVKTITVPSDAGVWMVQASTQNVRFTLDGTTPTATKGFLITAAQAPLYIPVEGASSIKVIEVSTTAVLDYQFTK